MKYKVKIGYCKKYFQKIVEVEASNQEEAENKSISKLDDDYEALLWVDVLDEEEAEEYE